MHFLTWPQRGWLWLRLFIRLVILVGVALGFFLLGPPVLDLIMPFLFALGLTVATEPLVRVLHEKLRIPRGFMTILFILLILGSLGGLLTLLILKGWRETAQLYTDWDTIWAAFQGVYLELGEFVDLFLAYLPQGLQDLLHEISDRLLGWLNSLAGNVMENIVPKTTNFARGATSFVLAFLFFLLAWYFTAADYPGLRKAVTDHTPASLQAVWTKVKHAFSAAFGGYIKAEVTISFGVMIILTLGFAIMGQSFGLLLAFLLAVLDFIPILGAGTVMVPWMIVEAILGNWREAVYLLIIWGVISLFRRTMEPKFVGDHTGLHPLLSLLAIYVGMKWAGVLGMVFGPVIVIMFRNLWKAGMFHASTGDVALAVQDIQAILNARVRAEDGQPSTERDKD